MNPILEQLLIQHDIAISAFQKKGRVSKEIVEKRSLVITYLHEKGFSWEEMRNITGLGNATIQRLSKGKKCEAVKNKLKNIGGNVGKSWKGKKREGQLERQWEKGDFDCLRGRKRTDEEKATLKKAWSKKENKEKASFNSKHYVWGNPEVVKKIMDFHLSPEQRRMCSEKQTMRMKNNPNPFLRGRSEIVNANKNDVRQVRVRSSYEKKAIEILDNDENVISYTYESKHIDNDGFILPDFVVKYRDKTVLIEVKSKWVLNLSEEHRVKKRLKRSEILAKNNNWCFTIWTEKELGLC